MAKPTTKKTVLEVYPEIYAKVRKQAAKSQQTTKRFTTLLLEFGVGKLEGGEIALVDASLADAPQNKAPVVRATKKREVPV